MSTFVRSLTVCIAASAASFVVAAEPATPATAVAFHCNDRFVPSAFERQVVSHSERGADALRDYLFITRGMHSMSYGEAVALVERVHGREHACNLVAAATSEK